MFDKTYADPSAYSIERYLKEKTMGRPINKKLFKNGTGNQLKVRAKIGSAAEGDGFIISQRSNKKFKVQVGADVGICTLVTKADGTLAAGEMSIEVLTDAGVAKKVSKLTNRVAWVDGAKTRWTFVVSATDNKVQATDAADTVTITIDTQPVDASVTAGETATFSVVASATSGSVKYAWQVSLNGTSWSTVTNGDVYSGAKTATLKVNASADVNAHQYRVVVSATGATSVESDAVTLTVA